MSGRARGHETHIGWLLMGPSAPECCATNMPGPRGAQTRVRGHMFKQGRMVLFFCLSLVTAQLFKMGGQLLLWQQETLLGQGQR